MLFLSDSVVSLSDFPTFLHPLAQINPLYLIIRILMVIEWGNMETYSAHWGHKMAELCDAYYEWSDYHQAEMELGRISTIIMA